MTAVAPEETTDRGQPCEDELCHCVCIVCYPPETTITARALCGTELEAAGYDVTMEEPAGVLLCVVCVDLVRATGRCPRCGAGFE